MTRFVPAPGLPKFRDERKVPRGIPKFRDERKVPPEPKVVQEVIVRMTVSVSPQLVVSLADSIARFTRSPVMTEIRADDLAALPAELRQTGGSGSGEAVDGWIRVI